MKTFTTYATVIILLGFSGGSSQAFQCTGECPVGTYAQSCCSCAMQTSTMLCGCLNTSGDTTYLSQIDITQCTSYNSKTKSGGIINNNGRLQCATLTGGTLIGTGEGTANPGCGGNAVQGKRLEQSPKK